MAILHSFVVIGVMFGYIFGAITVTVFEKFLSWRFAFMLQGWFMIFIGIGFIMTDNKSLDIFGYSKESGGNASHTREVTRPKSYSDAAAGIGQVSAPSSLVIVANQNVADDNVSSGGGVHQI